MCFFFILEENGHFGHIERSVSNLIRFKESPRVILNYILTSAADLGT